MAKQFVNTKLAAYEEMLKKFIKEQTFPGINQNAFMRFSEQAMILQQRIVLSQPEKKQISQLPYKVG